VRNSSLVERDCAENVTGLKLGTETRDFGQLRLTEVVGERPASGEGVPARCVGVGGSENAGMSSANEVRTLIADSLRFPTGGQSASG
jgi:hypothetical protein